MATPNNITKNWESVLRTAEIELVTTAQEANSLAQNSVVPLFDRKSILEQQVAAAKARIAAATANNQNTTSLQSTLARLESELSTVTRDYNTFNSILLQLENKVRSLRTQINEAKSQIATQAAKTTPATNTTVAATITPASARPGNPNIATTPAPTPTASTAPRPTNVTNVTSNTTSTASATVVTTPNSVTVITEASTTTTTGGRARTVTAPAPVAPIGVTLEPALPPLKLEPITVDVPQFDSRGRVTGNTQVVLDPQTTTNPSLITTESLPIPTVSAAELTALGDQANASVTAAILAAESEATAQDQANFKARADWRVRLALAPGSKYLYNAPGDPGILYPLRTQGGTDGVIFPYTPAISVNYAASYEQTNLVHSNYKIFQYSGSGVDSVSLSCTFTAQDEYEANYLLAVIHFFRSMTKMFYGQDENPKNGTPPPLCYMFGMGGYQFAAHPLAIQGFTYNLPDDVDYIKTTSASPAGSPQPSNNTISDNRLAGTGVGKGGLGPDPTFSNSSANKAVTWVPSRIQLAITCVPIMSRNSISNRFSLRDYAAGTLLDGTRVPGGGMW